MKIIEKIPVIKEIAVLANQMQKEHEKLEKNLRLNGHILREIRK